MNMFGNEQEITVDTGKRNTKKYENYGSPDSEDKKGYVTESIN